MRFNMFVASGLLLCACASPKPTGPVGADSVNPEIEQRIEQRVLEGRSKPGPKVSDIPSDPPDLPTAAELAQDRKKILASGVEVNAAVSEVRGSDDEEALAQKAKALLEQIERDKALLDAEGPLNVNFNDTDDADISLGTTPPEEASGEK